MEHVHESNLSGLHSPLLNVHKNLLDFERKHYESEHGKISNPNEYFNLVIKHPDFSWLRALSELIVLIDEVSSGKEGEEQKTEKEVLRLIKLLLSPNEQGSEFSLQYHKAIQTSAEVAHAHGQVMEAIKKLEAER